MSLSDDIRKRQKKLGPEGRLALQWVLDRLSVMGRKASQSAKDKSRGDSSYYSDLAKKRWGK